MIRWIYCEYVFLPLFEHICRFWREAIDAPVRPPVSVAHRDGESAKVSPVNLDGGTLEVIIIPVTSEVAILVLAGQGHVVALAAVVSLVSGAVGGQT